MKSSLGVWESEVVMDKKEMREKFDKMSYSEQVAYTYQLIENAVQLMNAITESVSQQWDSLIEIRKEQIKQAKVLRRDFTPEDIIGRK